MGIINIKTSDGVIEIEWNPENHDEVVAAEEVFRKYAKSGLMAFRMWDEERKGELIDRFDKYADKIVFMEPIFGG